MLTSNESGRHSKFSKEIIKGAIVTFKVRILDDKEFMQALQILAEANCVEPDVAYRVGRIHRRLQKELTETRKKCLKLLETYALKDDKGKIKNFPSGPFEFQSPEDERKHDMEFEDIMETELEEKVNPIPYDAIKGLKTKDGQFLLNGAEQVALEPILTFD